MAELKELCDDGDALYEECGVFGCVAAGPWPNTSYNVAADVIYPALVNLQHRGQEGSGIVTSNGDNSHHFEKYRKMGLVTQVFTKDVLSALTGNLGIGHTRYSTCGTSDENHCQPFLKEMMHGWFAVAHNGQLVNAEPLKKDLLRRGSGLSTQSDTEIIAQILCQMPDNEEQEGHPDWIGRITNLMKVSSTSYSLAIMYKDTVYGVRDPVGNRPLALGKFYYSNKAISSADDSPRVKEVTGWLLASESCCFQALGAEFVREVLPGEIVEVTKTGFRSLFIQPRPIGVPVAFCIFEYVYFSRPDTTYEVSGYLTDEGRVVANTRMVVNTTETSQTVYEVRKQCGRQLAIEAFVTADVVSTVPDSATPSALGYSAQSGLPYAEVLYKNSYIGRTFIKPTLRNQAVDMKFGALSSNVQGKRIILIDDSIVRGTTMQPIVALLRRAGAKEVHIRIASPPLYHPCYMGINIPTSEELIANQKNLIQLAEHIGADSVVYLSLDGLVKSVSYGRAQKSIKPMKPVENGSGDVTVNGNHLEIDDGCDKKHVIISDDASDGIALAKEKVDLKGSGYCLACLNGDYPIPIDW